MIGDRCSDVAAANAARLALTILLERGPDSPAAGGCAGQYRSVASLAEARQVLLEVG